MNVNDVMRSIKDNKMNKQNEVHLKNLYKKTELNKVCEFCVVSKQIKIIHHKEM